MGLINYLRQAGLFHSHAWRPPDIGREPYWDDAYSVRVCEGCSRVVAIPKEGIAEFNTKASDIYTIAKKDAEAAVTGELEKVYDHSSERVEVANAIMRTYERDNI